MLEDHVKVTLKVNTYNKYKSVINGRIVPALGLIKLKDVKPIHIDTFIAKERNTGVSETSLQLIYGVLNAALNRAKKLRIIVENPVNL